MTKDKKKNQKCSNCAKCEGKNCASCGEDEACKIQQRIFEREVDEELQQERLRNFWKKYRFLIYGGIVAVLMGTSGFEFYRSWWQKTRLAESDRYESALVNAYAGKTDQAIEQLKALAENGRTGYRYLAQLETAGILIASDKREEALPILASFIHDSSAPKQLRGAVVLAFVGQQIETGNAAELQALLAPMLVATDDTFSASAAELSALLYLRENQPDRAEQVIRQALTAGSISPQTQDRLTHFLSEIKQQ